MFSPKRFHDHEKQIDMNYDKTNNMTTYVNVVQNVELFIKPHWLGICTCASQANK